MEPTKPPTIPFRPRLWAFGNYDTAPEGLTYWFSGQTQAEASAMADAAVDCGHFCVCVVKSAAGGTFDVLVK